MLYLDRTSPNLPLYRAGDVSKTNSPYGIQERMSKRYLHTGNKKRMYNVYVPKKYKRERAVPLVMVLHGCRQTHRDIEAITTFNALAEKHNFIVVYPFVTHYNDMRTRNCWGWWRPEHIHTGAGEVEDLRCIITEVTKEFSIQQKRIHITGLSSGAGMTVAALVAHPGLFASGAAVAGLPYGERATAVRTAISNGDSFRSVDKIVKIMEKTRAGDNTPVPLFVVHSHQDETVNIQAGKNLRDSWLKFFGIGLNSSKSVRYRRTHDTPWIHTKYGKWFRKSMVETVFMEGPGHGWYGGQEGEFSYPNAPDVGKLIWKFFKSHPLK